MHNEAHGRASAQTRPLMPFEAEALHPRASELADTLLDLRALGGGVSFPDLICAGFTAAEINEHYAHAEASAKLRGIRQVSPSPDMLADMKLKAREPFPNQPLLPVGTKETQAILVAWGWYCAARQAFRIDPWPGQREHCVDRLRDYLDRLPLNPAIRKAIWLDVSGILQKAARS